MGCRKKQPNPNTQIQLEPKYSNWGNFFLHLFVFLPTAPQCYAKIKLSLPFSKNPKTHYPHSFFFFLTHHRPTFRTFLCLCTMNSSHCTKTVRRVSLGGGSVVSPANWCWLSSVSSSHPCCFCFLELWFHKIVPDWVIQKNFWWMCPKVVRIEMLSGSTNL